MISINPATKVIFIPQNYLAFISGTLYELDTNQFRKDLKNLEDDSIMMAFERTHRHNTEVVLLGTTFARVIEIINGYSITFEDLPYSVKLVGSNNNFFDVDGGILNRNQVQVISTNSAGSISSATDKEISENVNYSNGIYLDVTSEYSGNTSYPYGTMNYPVNNLTDAIEIGINRSQNIIKLAGTLILNQDVSGKEIISWKNGAIDINNQNCNDTKFKELKIYGQQNGMGFFYDCKIENLQNLNGNYENCKFLTTNVMSLAINSDIFFNNCRSGIGGNLNPIFDFTAGNCIMNNRAYSGGIEIVNSIHSTNKSTIEFIAGKLKFQSSNTLGEFHARGVCDISNIDSGGALLYTDGLVSNQTEKLNEIHIQTKNNEKITLATRSR